jgi:UDP-3-O-[3-hydroxymyristoyl] glucosamine N-acyltransferase
VVAASAKIDPTVHIGPWCVIGERVSVGPKSVLQAGNYVGEDCRLGEGVHLFPNVTLYPRCQLGNRVAIHAGSVIGSDGFGYVFDEGIHFKVQQIGNVIIQDDVEIGANVTIDRGALGSTIVGKGTKIDNLVQLAHNVVTGAHCILVSQTGIAGSTRLGNYVTLAGQSGLAGHLKIGDRAIVGAQAGVMNDVPEGGKYLGSPAQPDRNMKRQWVALRNMPELMQKMHEMEARLKELENRK